MAAAVIFLSPRPALPPPFLPFPFSSRATIINPQLYFPFTAIQVDSFINLPKIVPSASFRNNNGSESSETGDCPVPLDQQPINEYKALSNSFPFSWASADMVEYSSRLFVTGAAFALFVGLPVSWFGSVGPESDPLVRVLAAVSSGFLVVTLAVLRMYLGWAYVGNRLLSATVEYEETGWYDGQIWVKTAEVLARDRLLGSFSVKPVLNRLKNTLVALATSLFICVVIIVNSESSRKETYIISPEEAESSNSSSGAIIPRVYNDESARSFEPDAFCGEPQPSVGSLT